MEIKIELFEKGFPDLTVGGLPVRKSIFASFNLKLYHQQKSLNEQYGWLGS